MDSFGKFLMVIGIIMAAFGNIIGIGYGLYLWGGVGLTFAVAAWTAFKFWAVLMITGILSVFTGIFLR